MVGESAVMDMVKERKDRQHWQNVERTSINEKMGAGRGAILLAANLTDRQDTLLSTVRATVRSKNCWTARRESGSAPCRAAA